MIETHGLMLLRLSFIRGKKRIELIREIPKGVTPLEIKLDSEKRKIIRSKFLVLDTKHKPKLLSVDHYCPE